MNEPTNEAGPAKAKAASDVEAQYVSGEKLLELLFPADCRPTLRWLRDQQKARRVPHVKIGRLVFFSPAQVRRVLDGRAG